jgi:hypothetical protein
LVDVDVPIRSNGPNDVYMVILQFYCDGRENPSIADDGEREFVLADYGSRSDFIDHSEPSAVECYRMDDSPVDITTCDARIVD